MRASLRRFPRKPWVTRCSYRPGQSQPDSEVDDPCYTSERHGLHFRDREYDTGEEDDGPDETKSQFSVLNAPGTRRQSVIRFMMTLCAGDGEAVRVLSIITSCQPSSGLPPPPRDSPQP